jgi:hypothetical protein
MGTSEIHEKTLKASVNEWTRQADTELNTGTS